MFCLFTLCSFIIGSSWSLAGFDSLWACIWYQESSCKTCTSPAKTLISQLFLKTIFYFPKQKNKTYTMFSNNIFSFFFVVFICQLQEIIIQIRRMIKNKGLQIKVIFKSQKNMTKIFHVLKQIFVLPSNNSFQK